MSNMYIVRDNELKLTLPGPSCIIKDDGTIWSNGKPVLGLTDPKAKDRAIKALKANKPEDIPAVGYTRMGYNSNGLWAGWDEEWATHPAKIKADQVRETRETNEAKKVIIYLSSRGWGDYSPVNWEGDITRPDAEILVECQELLASGHDVDKRMQTDADIITKIVQAREKWAMPKIEYVEPDRGPGYCTICESYCYGDCQARLN